MRREWHVILHVPDVTENADDVAAAFEWYCAQFSLDPLTVGVQENAVVIRSFGRAEQVAHEDLVASAPVLRCEHRGHVATANIADNALCGRVDPSDDPVGVDRVCRNASTFEQVFHVSAECLQSPDGGSVASRRVRRQTVEAMRVAE